MGPNINTDPKAAPQVPVTASTPEAAGGGAAPGSTAAGENEQANATEASAGAAGNTGAAPEGASPAPGGIDKDRQMAMLGYVLPFLFFLPLLDEQLKRRPFVRFHANQQLILLIFIVGVSLMYSTVLSVLSMVGVIIGKVLQIGVLFLMAYGAYNAYRNRMKELPYIGSFKIVK